MQADISQPAGFLRPLLEHEARHLSPFCIDPHNKLRAYSLPYPLPSP